jgi:predicted methyltransferase
MNKNPLSGSIWSALGATALLFCLNACDRPKQPPAAATEPAATAAPAAPTPSVDVAAVEAAIASTERLAGDHDEDGWRKPKEVLTFLGVRPGMHVLDYFSAGGYYTELLSRIVGESGQVIAYNNAAYLKFARDKPEHRYGANRLPNVAQLTTPPGDLPLPAGSLDAALFVMSYHDLYWQQKDPDWGVIDPPKAVAKLVAALKPGAVVVVVDHIARAGGDTAATVDALHRIDPAVVRRDFEAAGLVFDGESTALRRTSDDHSRPVFDPAVQHQTDQFIYRFRKP